MRRLYLRVKVKSEGEVGSWRDSLRLVGNVICQDNGRTKYQGFTIEGAKKVEGIRGSS